MPQSALEALNSLRPGIVPMGVVSEGCQGHGETGVGAAAAVATGKKRSREGRVGEGWCHKRGWVVRMDRVNK